MAATDTVAVVSLLHSVGATPKLTILVVGESLINDGSAMALFTLFFQALQGQTYTVESVISFCVATVFGSVLLGIGFGVVCVRWLKSANNPLEERDITIQIAITFCCAYLSFFTAQYALELSGVLSCCAAGAVFACLAPRIILQHESMHNVWSIAEWGLNTLIFLLAGLMIGHRVLNEVNAMDWVYMFVLYVALVVARFLTMLVLFPLISRIGHGCSFKEICFMSWAGLRGALGMALAVIVHKRMENEDKEIATETSRLLFYVGGISAMTLVINATTSKHVLFGLGLLSTNSAEKQLVTNQVKKKLRKKMNKVISQLTQELSLRTQDLDVVRDACSLLQDMNMDKLYRESEQLMRDQLRLSEISGEPKEIFSDMHNSAAIFTTIPLISTPELSQVPKPQQQHDLLSAPIEHAPDETDSHFGEAYAEDTVDYDEMSAHSGGTRSTARILAKDYRRHSHRQSTRKKHSSLMSSATSYISGMSTHSGGTHKSVNKHASLRSQRYLSGANSFYLPSSLLSAKIEASEASRLDYFSRLVSIGNRDSRTILDEDLLAYVRSIFLEIVRVKYWHLIEVGKLPRISHSAQYLLYTIDCALDDVQNVRDSAKAALQAHNSTTGKHRHTFSAAAAANGTTSARYITADWRCLLEDIDYRPFSSRIGEWWEGCLFSWCESSSSSTPKPTSKKQKSLSKRKSSSKTSTRRNKPKHLVATNSSSASSCCSGKGTSGSHGCGGGLSYWLDREEARRDKRAVYMLTAFIEAHEHAQKKLHQFLGGLLDNEHHDVGDYHAPEIPPIDSPGDHQTILSDQLTATPEETKVLTESKDAVNRARKRLNEIPKVIVKDIRARQVSRMVLAKEAELVKNMVEEGLLSSAHATVFMEEIRNDVRNIEDDREQFYHEKHKHESIKHKERSSDLVRAERHQSMRQKMFQSLSSAANHVVDSSARTKLSKPERRSEEGMQLVVADPSDYSEEIDEEDDDESDDEDDGNEQTARSSHVSHNLGNSKASSSVGDILQTDHAALLASIVDSDESMETDSPWDAMKNKKLRKHFSMGASSNRSALLNPEDGRPFSMDSGSSVHWSQRWASTASRLPRDDEDSSSESSEGNDALRSRLYSGFADDDDVEAEEAV
jgi:NhaP-type Na+/H+ or K+/H+ antiporter/polyhydroxyalkanoate synthesis regulator phasin